MQFRIKGLGDNLPIKLVATVLVAILIPSVLVTALGLVTVFQADGFVKRFVREARMDTLRRVHEEVGRRWAWRLGALQARLLDAGDRGGALAGLRSDPAVLDVLLGGERGPRLLPPRAPARVLSAPIDDAACAEPRRLEALGPPHLEEALRAWEGVARAAEDEAVIVEALHGVARAARRLGDVDAALSAWRRLDFEAGDTVDETGVPRGLLARVARLEIAVESRPTLVEECARELLDAIESERGRVDEPTIEWIESRLERLLPDGFDIVALRRGVLRPSPWRLGVGDLERLRGVLQAAAARAATTREADLRRVWLEGPGETSLLTVPIDGSRLLVHVLLDPSPFLDDARRVVDAVGPDRDRVVVDPDLVLSRAGDRGPSRPAAAMALPAPFASVRLGWVPHADEAPVGFRSLEVLTLATFTWAVILLVLTIIVGVFYTLRYVLRETRTARLKSDFVGFISHELKTPLAAIRMFTETILSGRVQDREETETCLLLIDKESERLSRLIDTVLEYSRIERQQTTFRFTSCSMGDVVDEAVKLFHDHTKDRPRPVEVHSVQHISKIHMDRASMIELILNLLSNADKYSPPGEKVVVNIRETVEEIAVEVIDRGVGIPKRDQKRIFEKFFRSNDYLTRSVEGTGLGLAFARYIAKVHNGEIRVSSQLNVGSTFTLHLRKTHVLAE